MSVTAREIVEEARLLRQSGHNEQSKRLLAAARRQFPSEPALDIEERRVNSACNPSYRRCRLTLSWLVDRLGLPVFFLLMAGVAYLLAPILFVPSW